MVEIYDSLGKRGAQGSPGLVEGSKPERDYGHVTAVFRIMEHELAGVVRYTHYSLMIYGYTRSWFRRRSLRGKSF